MTQSIGAAGMAHHGNGSSLSDLERQAESTRAELAQTVDALHNRVSPEALKRDAKDYAWQSGQQFLHTVESKARENPLAALAVAAGIALPLWRMVSNIPAPILLVGAGLAMSRRGSGMTSAGGHYASDHSGPSLTEKASDVARSVSEKVGNVIEDTQYKADVMSTRVTGAIKDTANTARAMAGDAADAARSMASDAATAVTETTSDMRRHAVDRFGRTQDSVMNTLERNPLLVGGLAFAIGGLIASALPVTRSENRFMGSASDRIKDRAMDAAEEGVEAVQAAAGQVYEDVTAQARDQGLTPDTARNTVKKAMEQAGTLVEQAAASVEDSLSNSTGGRLLRKQKTSNLENDNG